MPGRIVVAEDDPDMLCILVEVLEADGYDVEQVSDGGRLLVRLTRPAGESAPIDLVVSDIRMPIYSGLQILEALRAAGRAVPVILMTGFVDDETRERAQRLGARLFDKPLALDDLRAVVAQLTGARDHAG